MDREPSMYVVYFDQEMLNRLSYMLLYWSRDPYNNVYNCMSYNRVQDIGRKVYYYDTITNFNIFMITRNYTSPPRKLFPEAKIWSKLAGSRRTSPPPSSLCPCVCPFFRPSQNCQNRWKKRDFIRLSKPWSNWSTRTCQESLITGAAISRF